MPDFLERLRNGPPITADGGMGPLVSAAAPRTRCPEEANIRAPDTVVSVHLSFINAGAELIETNTFGANRQKLAARYLEDDFLRINEAGVKLARDARQVSGQEVFIAGSIGPLGEHEESWPEDYGPLFAEQAARTPDAVAVESSERRLTYRELDEQANRIAHYLKRNGVAPKMRFDGIVKVVVEFPGALPRRTRWPLRIAYIVMSENP